MSSSSSSSSSAVRTNGVLQPEKRQQQHHHQEPSKRTGSAQPHSASPLDRRRRPRAAIESLTDSEVTWHITLVAGFTCTSVAALASATYSAAAGVTVLVISGVFVALGMAALPFIQKVIQVDAIESVRASIKTGDVERIEDAVSHAKAVGVAEDKLQSLPEVRLALRAGIGEARTQQACRHLESVVRCALEVNLLAQDEAEQLLMTLAGTAEASGLGKGGKATASSPASPATTAAATVASAPAVLTGPNGNNPNNNASRARSSTCSSVVSGCSVASSSSARRHSSSASSCCSSSLSGSKLGAGSTASYSSARSATTAVATMRTPHSRAASSVSSLAGGAGSSSSCPSQVGRAGSTISSSESLAPTRSRRATVGRARAMLEAAVEVPEVENLRAAIELAKSVDLDGMEMELAKSVLRREERKRLERAEKELAAATQGTDAVRLRSALEEASIAGVGAPLLARGEHRLRALGAHQCLPFGQYQAHEGPSKRSGRSSSEAHQARSHSPAASLASMSTASTSSRKVSWALQEGETLEWDIVEMPPELL